ncbi:exopolyphosphatase, Ppx/GppA family [Campylobacter blaseri]|uniref:Disulfide bond formation protein DsbA n=1 Tax=Campylobacter blaseri TaxID=2042961 RepID=A0A2P8R0B3_9BACT|nr:disulfide bond formation protein DsbA [Campylobacter blaseri]PSM51930.1 disulfide bond formation protein DsbA [Campylobacter blaseri]PSM53714.1 disulfide bond formation protein DsbA [Campylobacter blaseri]QKF85732.1 exopolyphosphatase, Ppx/GppA family [Campylobacter blaseri]
MVIGIDLGSNTLRVALMNERFEILKSYEIIVGSAKDLKDGGNLSPNSKNNIINALEKIKAKFNFNKFKYIAVATEAFRIAKDSKEFFKFIKDKFNINFEIIDGISESKFTRLAVEHRLSKLSVNFKDILAIDLGGASTEISNKHNFKTYKFGIIKLYNESKQIKDMKENAKFAVKDAKEFISKLDIDKVVLTSGVPTTLAALNNGLDYKNYDENIVNGSILKYDDFDIWIEKIIHMEEIELEKLFGKDRAMYILGGIFILKELLKPLAMHKYIVVNDGLREGVMISEILKYNKIKG